MKRDLLFMSVLASLLVTGCSSDDYAPDDVTGGDGKTTTSYITVNLVTPDAPQNAPQNAPQARAAAGYEDGTEAESTVSSVRFYFFNGLGGAVKVKHQSNGYVNYYDWPTENDGEPVNDNDDIEKILSATIVINTAEGDAIPQRIAAVINPPADLLPSVSMSLTDLKAKVADFAAAGLTTKGNFVMYNSVGGGGKDVSTALIETKNLCDTETDAINNPVTIYVERSVAKVKVMLSSSVGLDSNNRLALKRKTNTGTEEALTVKSGDGDQQVYLKLNGWGLTAETSEGRLIKKVNPEWVGKWYDTYRSYWAINSMSATNRYYDYNKILTSFGDNNELYTNENAQTNDIDASVNPGAKEKTKVIISGTLCDASGNPLTIVRHLGQYFVDDANLTNLKNSTLSQLKASGYDYYFGTDSGREGIGTADIEIVATNQKANEDSKNNCYVYARLTETAKEKTWYNSSDPSVTTTVDYSTINSCLSTESIVDRALVWNSGETYYYYTIKHIENLAGEGTTDEGVVRNHIYATTVTKIFGLGTPVYDPGLTIYPEKPDDEEQYIAAEIKVLSWRVVTSDYELTW